MMISQRNLLGKRVLVVDGDELVRDSMVAFLEDKGCELTACGTAREGVEVLDREDFDIILCDHCLPNQDGFTFADVAENSRPGCSRVLMMSPTETTDLPSIQELGFDAGIEKPLTVESVESCLAQMMDAT